MEAKRRSPRRSRSLGSSSRSYRLTLTTDQLDSLLNLLKRCDFPQARWYELGLTLGLLKNTLDVIEKNYPGDIFRCFTECLSRWLSRADNVDSKGGVTFHSLSNAFKSMNENAAADKLDREKLTMALLAKGVPSKMETPPKSGVGTRVALLVEKFEYPTSSPVAVHKFTNKNPDKGNVKALKGQFEKGEPLKEAVAVDGNDDTSRQSPEYVILKEMLADIVDQLAGNASVISQFSNYLLSSDAIPRLVHLAVTDTLTTSTPADRAGRIMNSLLTSSIDHDEPSRVISSLIDSLQKVDLTSIANKMKEKLNLRKSLLPVVKPQSTIVIQLSTKEEVGFGLENLNRQFASIIKSFAKKIRNLVENNKLKLQTIVANIEKYVGTNLKIESLENIFTSITPYYDFLNYGLIKYLVQNLIPEDHKLRDELRQYVESVEKLSSSSQLKHLRSPVPPSPLLTRTNEQIIIKFHKRWEMITMSRFDDALKHYFEEFYSGCYKNFDSTIFITLSIAKSQADNFIKAVRKRRDALERIGIIEVAVGQKKISITGEDEVNFNASLCQSVKAGDSFEVSMLLQLGADPNSKDEIGKSAVEIAIEGGHKEVLKCLLVSGANGSVFISAVMKDDERVVKLLLDAHIDINFQGKDEKTALIVATQHNCEAMVHLLLQQKAIVIDKADNLGYTALHYACMKGFGRIVTILLESKADIHLHTKNGSTPLTLATQYEHQDIVKILRSSCLVTESEEMEALAESRTPAMQRLLVAQTRDDEYVPSPKAKRNTIKATGNNVEIIAPSFEKCQEEVAKWKDTKHDKTQNITIRESSCESVSFVVSHVLEKQIAKGLKIAAMNTPLTRDSVKSFSAQLSCSDPLRWLTVAHNSIGDEGLEVLAESLSSNQHVTVLSLYGNPNITSAESLVKLIETNTSLTYLSAWGTKIGQDGVLLLLNALKKNTHLITLVLDDKDEKICQSHLLYQDVKDRIIFNTLPKIVH